MRRSALLLIVGAGLAAAQTTTCTGGALPPGTGEDLEVTTETCTVGAGTYQYRNVNIYNGGTLSFSDAKIDFWAQSILVEKSGSLLAGSSSTPIGTNGGLLTIHLYGQDQGTSGAGITCKTDERCGVDVDTWTSKKKVNLPGGVNDYFYQYESLLYDGADPKGYFGYKVLAVSYGGTLALYGAKGSKFGPPVDSDSGTSWARLDSSVTVGSKTFEVDRPVDWKPGDQIVVTTTDYLPGHSEQLTIDTVTNSPNGSVVTVKEGFKFPHNGEVFDLSQLPKGIGPDPHPGNVPPEARWAETRAAVALLTRSIRIVSAGEKIGDNFPAESTGYYFGAHTIFRQGFQSVQVQGVEFYQMGQGARMGHYPIHFHDARRVPEGTLVADCSIHDSMTRWITIHATQGVTLLRNVGYKSIGHGFYLEDGTETDNKLYSNIGIFARGSVDNIQNPRKVPGILAQPYPAWNDPIKKQEDVRYHSDIDHPTVFWITNGWNDFAHNMAAGAGTCGVCYWLVPMSNTGLSTMQEWEGYAAMQNGDGRAGMTPLFRFEGNSCTTAMNSFNTVGNTTPCLGVVNPPPDNSPQLTPLYNPNLVPDFLYPNIDGGGSRFATRCPDGADCSKVPKCATGTTDNCMVTVLDRYTTSFNWAETNFSAIWLRQQWYLLVNSAITDVQNAGVTFVTGGGYTKSDVVDGHWALVKKTAFIGSAQSAINNPFASNAGPFNPKTPLRCATQVNSNAAVGNFCLDKDSGISMPLSNFGVSQRLFNIYDGPAYQESNAYMSILRTTLEDCQPQPNGGTCAQSKYMYGVKAAIPKGQNNSCYLPNAAIGWKQPNGFYYPPAFHSSNLLFQDVDIRHYVIEPLFLNGTYQTDPVAAAQRYCTWVPGMFTGFTDIDRQTELTDDDGSMTGLVNTVSVNQDPFFKAPLEVPQCASDVAENVPPGTATTSPYDYVTTAIVPECGYNCVDWNQNCSTPDCYGVPLYRQYKLPSETGPVSIRMAGQFTAQRSTLTVNKGIYYIDTTVSKAQQGSLPTVFQAGQTYYTFLLFAKPTTRQTYQIYVGPGFDVSTGVFMARANTDNAPVKFTRGAWPASWPAPQYDATTGLLTVTMDMGFPQFQTEYQLVAQNKCKPQSFCSWNQDTNACGTSLGKTDPLFTESQSVCSKWPVKDVDCPAGGCYAFGVTLSPGFTTGPKPNLPPPAVPFPNNSDWNGPFVTAPESVTGKQCYYPAPPLRTR